ncbi:hypothetical protein NEOLEDRAFT_1044329, partial [Neolentinus lepideus HHB14362 ss-1]
KIRALISLYHQADRFITKENLDEAIDTAFTRPTRISSVFRDEANYGELELQVIRRRQSPKTADWRVSDRASATIPDQNWRDSTKTAREIAVAEALFGTAHANKPGLDALGDHSKRIEKLLENER